MTTTILQNGTTLNNATIAVGDTDEITDNNNAIIAGTLDNLGTLFADSTGDGTYIAVINATLTGNGEVLLSDFSQNTIEGNGYGNTLTNAGNIIAGSGFIGTYNLAVVNQAGSTIDATGTNANLQIDTTGVFDNQGLLEGTGPAGLQINGSTVITNSGTGEILAAGGPVSLTNGADIVGGTLAGSNGGQISAYNATLDGTTSPVTITAGTTVTADNNATLVLLGTLDNLGTVFVDSYNGYGTDLQVGNPTGTAFTLTGTGEILLSDVTQNNIEGEGYGNTLVNAGNIIAGSGDIGGYNLSVVNLAGNTIDATGTNANLLIQTTGTFINAGLLEDTGPAGLQINSTVITNTGSGEILAAGGPVSLTNSTDIVGGSLVDSNGGQISAYNATLDGSTSPVTITAGTTVTADNNATLVLLGTLDNLGTVFVDSNNGYTTNLQVGNPTGTAFTLTGTGEILLSDVTQNNIEGEGYGNTLVNAGNIIAGSGVIGGYNLSVVNQAGNTIDATGTNANLLIQTAGTFINAGVLEDTGPAGLQINSTVITNTGTGEILAAGGPVSLTNSTDIVGGSLVDSNGGQISAYNATLDGSISPVTITAGTTVTADNNATLVLLGTLDNLGTVFVDSYNGYGTDLQVGNPTGTAFTLTGTGEILLSDVTQNNIEGEGYGNTLVNAGNIIAGSGDIGGYNLSVVNLAGNTIDATGTNANLLIQTTGTFINASLLEDTGPAGLQINSTVITNTGSGEILAAGGPVSLTNSTDIVGGSLVDSNGGQISAYNATLDGSTSPVTITAGTTVTADNNATLVLLGTLDNLGTVFVDSNNGYTTNLQVGNPTGTAFTLTGTGEILLSDVTQNNIEGEGYGNTLVNAGNIIAGSGVIGGYNLSVVNQAGNTIDATGTNADLLIQTAGTFVNAGVLEDTGPAGLQIISTTITNTGTGDILAAGGPVIISSADIVGGTLVASGGGQFYTSNATLDGSTSPVTIASATTVTADNNTNLLLLGTLDNLGTLFSDSSGGYSTTLQFGTPNGTVFTLTGTGEILLSDAAQNAIEGDGYGYTLVNAGNIIAGSGDIGGYNLVVYNQAGGTIDATGTNALIIQSSGTAVFNAGLLEGTGAGGLDIFATVVDNLAGGTIAAGVNAEVFFRSDAGATNLANGTLTGGEWLSEAGGSIVFQAGTSITSDAADIILTGSGSALSSNGTLLDASLTTITSAGTLALLGARGWTGANALTDAGLLQLGGGTFDAPSLAVTGTGHVLGFGTIADGGTNAGLIEANGGTLVLSAPPSGTGTLQTDSFATLELGGASAQTVVFDPGHATLRVDTPSSYTGTLAGIIATDTLDLAGVSATGATSSGTLLTVTLASNGTLTYDLAAPLTGIREGVTADGTGGTDILFSNVACFAAGTRIATLAGEVAVEDLREGDRVLTASGKAMPALWIGRRTLAPREHYDPSRAQPVRIAPAAFGSGAPAAELRLSPEHAVFVRGVFIPVRHLVNGSSIVAEDVAEVTYYHIGLARHEVVLANRLPVESWLDTGIHRGFENPPKLSLRSRFPCKASAPVVEAGPLLELVRRDLAVRARRLGMKAPAVFDVELNQAGATCVIVPAGTDEIRLRSGAAMHAGDRRRLGAAIGRVRLGGNVLALGDARLQRGFHPVDHAGTTAWRWTEGEAFIKVATTESLLLEIEVVAVSQSSVAA